MTSHVHAFDKVQLFYNASLLTFTLTHTNLKSKEF